MHHGLDWPITNERCITVQRFSQAFTNVTLRAQQSFQKKEHASVWFVLNAFVKDQWKIITGKRIKGISRGLGVNLAAVNVVK